VQKKVFHGKNEKGRSGINHFWTAEEQGGYDFDLLFDKPTKINVSLQILIFEPRFQILLIFSKIPAAF